jgi:hypothetical protein
METKNIFFSVQDFLKKFFLKVSTLFFIHLLTDQRFLNQINPVFGMTIKKLESSLIQSTNHSSNQSILSAESRQPILTA